MYILAVETSCDETSAAVVEDGRLVLSNVISSQADFHAHYGGVIPEFAARQHLEVVNFVVEAALQQANLTVETIDAFAATMGPGLVGALLVGANTAKTLSLLTQKPFLGVHHLQGHIASNYLETDLKPPFLCLLVSGGHTQLLHVKAFDQIDLMGQTLDDAVGEAYDKVARILGLPYPGGPALDALAHLGDARAFALPQARTAQAYDFSFSGLKTAVLRLFEQTNPDERNSPEFQANLAASFQKTVCDTLVTKTLNAATALNMHTVCIAGGVAANRGLRTALMQKLEALGSQWSLHIPALAYCTDNAAMIASAAYFNPLTTDHAAEVFSRSKPTA